MKIEDFPTKKYCLGYGIESKCNQCQNLKNWHDLNNATYNGQITSEEMDSIKSQLTSVKIDACVLSGRPHFVNIVPLNRMN